MAKNILVFSDGTGQAGGLIPDEAQTNVYKLYRATRCGPTTNIDPAKQLALYDPGLGSDADGGGFKISWGRWFYNLVSKATGLGITRNIIDCYAAIIRMYEPGDRIWLIGFSRGAYTVRCVGGVLALCGVPTSGKQGKPLLRDESSAKAIAREAVIDVYQHGSGRKHPRFKRQRLELAEKFREDYSSGNNEGSNEVPYFIGVWDTVAAVGASWPRLIALVSAALVTLWMFAVAIRRLLAGSHVFPPYWEWVSMTVGTAAVAAAVVYTFSMLRYARGLSDPWWKTLHLTQWKLRFYDKSLNPRVKFAKHALSIDENRKDFARVEWSDHGDRPNDDAWFEQVWFAGVHSDVGGSYPENEARLSDIALQWMVEKATGVPNPIEIDTQYLRLHPSPSGPQHDERKASRLALKEGLRTVPADAPLHPTVLERFNLDGVLVFDEMRPYRPEALRHHQETRGFYRS